MHLLGNTDVGGSNINVATNGNVSLSETAGPMRIGAITTTRGDVTLNSANAIVVSPTDAAADVSGSVVNLNAASGIGTSAAPLDVDSGFRFNASAGGDVFLVETAGNINVGQIATTAGNVTLTATAGSAALYLLAPDARQFASEPTFEVKGFPIRAAAVFESTTRRLLGFQYESDAPGTYWFDEKMLAIQAIVDKKLPATINALNCAGKDENRVCVVRSGSDQQPSKFYLFQPERNEWTVVGETRPWINPRKMARVDFHRFQARDGLSIPVYVTTPTDGASGPRPAVVLIHGGPNVRGGHWVWNPQAQFLASRGYLVIEADYRGSTGYGFKHFQAGWKQWGLAMQDDIADATNWAIAKGFADKNRIAIGGASYGGYATLMGLIKNPELFRCGFEWAGVTDIDLRFSVTWSDASDRILRYDLRTLMGDPEKDAAQFQATSPLRLHKHLTQPLLLGYGASDRRVPLVHGTKLRDEVMKHNDHVEWVAYDLEGHGWALTKNNIDWWTRVEKFLERNMQR